MPSVSLYRAQKFAKVTATTNHKFPEVADYRHFMFAVHADAVTTGSVRVKASFTQDIPDFSLAASSTNSWEYVAIRELSSGTLLAGATGAAVSASTIHKNYEAELNGAYHVAFEVTFTSGDGISVNAFLRND